jgi:hypothetical protein
VIPLEVHADDVLGRRLGLLAALGELDAAGLPAAPDVYLCLHGDGVADVLGRLDYLVYRRRQRRVRRRNPCVGEDPLRLILV